MLSHQTQVIKSTDSDESGFLEDVQPSPLTRPQAFNLYTSHAFSTWNARGYEFAAILFTAAAYPNTLSAAALRMVIVYFAMIVFSANVGRWVESSPNRLWTLQASIVVNRGSVIVASVVWLAMLSQEDLLEQGSVLALPRNTLLKGFLFALAISLGIIERLSSAANLISMERDWVVTVAAPSGHPYDLTNLNAVMRRIDLVCKLISPIVISAVVTAVGSMRIGVLFTGLTSLLCLPIEMLTARRAWKSSPALQSPKPPPKSRAESHTTPTVTKLSWWTKISQYFSHFEVYFSTSAWIPSLALSMLHYNMMTWRATFITYLINVGYSLNLITIARTLGSVFEISSTVLTPVGVRLLGRAANNENAAPRLGHSDEGEEEAARGLIESPRDDTEEINQQHYHDKRTLIGLQRFGLWGFSIQVVNLIPVVLALWAISSPTAMKQPAISDGGDASGAKGQSSGSISLWLSLVLFGFLALSRLGVWIFDLTTQQLAQMIVPARERSSFAGVENSVVNVFELLGAASAIAFPSTEQFKWLASASWCIAAVAWVMYALWVRRQRGHLFHWRWKRLGSQFQGL